MLLIMVKPNVTLRFVSVSIWGVSARTGKNIKFTKNSAVHDHMLVCNNIVLFENFSILANGTNDFIINLQESLLIHCYRPQLNKTSESAPLMLFS